MADMLELTRRYVRERVQRHEFSPATAKTVRHTLFAFALSVEVDPSKLRRRHVERWVNTQAKSVSAGTLRGRISVVATFCRWAVLHKHMKADPTVGVSRPKRRDTVPRAIPEQAVGQLIDTCPDLRGRLVVCLMVEEGLRRAEVAGLEMGDVDLHARMLHVVGKGGVERFVPLTAMTQQAMLDYLGQHPAVAGPLIRSYLNPHRPITADHVGRLVAAWMYEAGVKDRPRDGKSAHALRHTCLSDIVDRGAHIREVQHIAGHKHLATTEIYLRRVDAASLRPALEGRTYGQEQRPTQPGLFSGSDAAAVPGRQPEPVRSPQGQG